jgi:hypothetical protein
MMNADALVHILLEMNVINPGDVDREINKLATQLYDPRAQKWFRRVVRYWLLNMDQLAGPATINAEPRGHYGSKYYASPTGGWEPERGPEEIPQQKMGKWWGEKPLAGDASKCPNCGGVGKLKKIGKKLFVYDPEHAAEDTQTVRCPRCNGTGEHVFTKPTGGEGFFTGEALMRRMLEAESYDPKSKTYTTALHSPRFAKDITGSFIPFTPTKAKPKSLHGHPPAKPEVPGWMKGKQTYACPRCKARTPTKHNGETVCKTCLDQGIITPLGFQHFDPIQVKRRDLFSRLQGLVFYLNHLAKLRTKQPDPEMSDVEKQRHTANAEAAEKTLADLAQMKTDDTSPFHALLRSSEQFMTDVKEKPWLFMNDGKVIARHGNLTLKKTVTIPMCQALARRKNMSGENSTVCLRDERAKGYLESGPVYFIDKGDQFYLAASFPGNQVHDPKNRAIGDAEALEIAPLFVNRPLEFPVDLLAQGNRKLASEVARLRHLAGVR